MNIQPKYIKPIIYLIIFICMVIILLIGRSQATEQEETKIKKTVYEINVGREDRNSCAITDLKNKISLVFRVKMDCKAFFGINRSGI